MQEELYLERAAETLEQLASLVNELDAPSEVCTPRAQPGYLMSEIEAAALIRDDEELRDAKELLLASTSTNTSITKTPESCTDFSFSSVEDAFEDFRPHLRGQLVRSISEKNIRPNLSRSMSDLAAGTDKLEPNEVTGARPSSAVTTATGGSSSTCSKRSSAICLNAYAAEDSSEDFRRHLRGRLVRSISEKKIRPLVHRSLADPASGNLELEPSKVAGTRASSAMIDMTRYSSAGSRPRSVMPGPMRELETSHHETRHLEEEPEHDALPMHSWQTPDPQECSWQEGCWEYEDSWTPTHDDGRDTSYSAEPLEALASASRTMRHLVLALGEALDDSPEPSPRWLSSTGSDGI